jgi:hypothetical protein
MPAWLVKSGGGCVHMTLKDLLKLNNKFQMRVPMGLWLSLKPVLTSQIIYQTGQRWQPAQKIQI